MKTKQFILVQVLANPFGDVTNGGVTSGKLSAYAECTGGNFTEADVLSLSNVDKPVLVRDTLPIGRIVMLKHGHDVIKRPAFGGNWVYSEDARFTRAYGDNPVKIYDRYE